MKIDRQFVFSVVVGIMMITWAMGMALSYNIKTTPQGMKIDNVYDRPLTGTEKVTILKTGRVLIEYLYTEGPDSSETTALYENFVARFSDYAVLEMVEVSADNQTSNQMIVPSGDIIPLDNVTTSDALLNLFCENSLVQPRECLLKSV